MDDEDLKEGMKKSMAQPWHAGNQIKHDDDSVIHEMIIEGKKYKRIQNRKLFRDDLGGHYYKREDD